MTEFQIENHVYRAGAMDAFTQLAVASKVSPLLASGFGELFPFFMRMRKEGITNIADVPLKEATSMLTPVAHELAAMTEEDRRFIIGACLSICERQEVGKKNWNPLWNAAAGGPAHKDINEDAFLMIKIVLSVLQGKLGRFFPADLFK